ncbi:MAG: CHASE2 domain-containing protein, partial [Pyrinomonadaceae bacterium]
SIDEHDYKEDFNETSPLAPDKLNKIIEAVAKGKPRLIAIDLDTSAQVFRNLQPPAGTPIVWARGAKPTGNEPGTTASAGGDSAEGSFSSVSRTLFNRLNPFHREERLYEIGDVLGGAGNDLPSGAALLLRDVDSGVRRYRRTFKTTDQKHPAIESFPWAVVREYKKQESQREGGGDEPEEGWVINFVVDEKSFRSYPSSAVVRASKGTGWGEGDNALVKDKIVLLGGMYRVARDLHSTPSGPKYGVELVAYAVESELQGKTISPPPKPIIWIAELLVGFALVLVYDRFQHRRWALRITLTAIPLLALLASFIVFSSLSMWVTFMPVLLVVFVQQLYEDLQHYRKRKMEDIYEETKGLWAELRQLWKDLRQFRTTLNADLPQNPGPEFTNNEAVPGPGLDGLKLTTGAPERSTAPCITKGAKQSSQVLPARDRPK